LARLALEGSGSGGEIVLLSPYDVISDNDSPIAVSGGSALGEFGYGGCAGEVTMYAGNHVACDNHIFANGGNAGSVEGSGGNGGLIDLFSEIVATSIDPTDTLSVKGGTPDGYNGNILLDFTDVTPPDGTLP
jgi:hypothetical protein